MRCGFPISVVVHTAFLVWCLISPSAKPFDTPPVDSVPVDLISTTEFTQMMAGSKQAAQAEAPKPVVDKVAEPTPAKDPTPKVSDKKAVAAATEEKQVTEPPPPEPKPEANKKPEPKTDPIAEEIKKQETKKPPPVKKTAQRKFDADKITALLDKRDPQRQANTGTTVNQTPTLGTATGNAVSLSQSEIDALRAQIQACWNPPAGALEAKDLVVKIRLMLNQDGSVSGEPTVLNRGTNPFFQVAAESAKRAIQRCQPYRLPIAKYDAWKDVEVTFDPRDMFNG